MKRLFAMAALLLALLATAGERDALLDWPSDAALVAFARAV